MCKYCEHDVNNETCNLLSSRDIAIGLVMEVYIMDTDSKEEPMIMQFTLGNVSNDFYDVQIPIKYCPFCGEKLV